MLLYNLLRIIIRSVWCFTFFCLSDFEYNPLSVKRSPHLLNSQEVKIDKGSLKVVCKSMKRIRLREKSLR